MKQVVGVTFTSTKTKLVTAEKLLYCCAACLLPNIFLFFLYKSNKALNDIPFLQCLMLAAVLGACSVAVFTLFRIFAKGFEGALIGILLFWLSFWLFEQLFALCLKLSTSFTRILLLACLIVCGILVLLFFRQHRDVLHSNQRVFCALAAIVCGLFAFNFLPALYDDFLSVSGAKKAYELRTEFIVDPSCPHPDIYWLHMDGMMGFDAVEKHFGDTQDGLKEEIKSRGFVLNKNAAVEGDTTRLATPALTCPDYYDSYLRGLIQEAGHLRKGRFSWELYRLMARDGVRINEDIAPNLELLHAFIAGGYTEVTIANSTWFFVPVDRYYRTNTSKYPYTDSKNAFMSEPDDLMRLLFAATPLSMLEESITDYMQESSKALWHSIPAYDEIIQPLVQPKKSYRRDTGLYRALIDSFTIQSPKLVYAQNHIAHTPFTLDEMGCFYEPTPENSFSVDLYLPQHRYAAKVMLNTIDMILEQNRDAVIVLQADHGIHMDEVHEDMRKKGYSDEDVIEINQSVISAVRIPASMGGLDGPLDPLNITRLLVNRYVGENYALLPKK